MAVRPGTHPAEVPASADDPGAAAVVAGLLGCLYLVIVESAAAVVAGLTVVGGIAVVLVSAGLVEALPEAELGAVLAHEVAHLANGDSRVMGAVVGPVWRPTTGPTATPTNLATTSGTGCSVC